MVMRSRRAMVARARWIENGGWWTAGLEPKPFFSQYAQDCSHSQNFGVYQSAGVRDSITSFLITRQNPLKQSLFGELNLT